MFGKQIQAESFDKKIVQVQSPLWTTLTVQTASTKQKNAMFIATPHVLLPVAKWKVLNSVPFWRGPPF